MRPRLALFLFLAACGDDSGGSRPDATPDDEPDAELAAPDAEWGAAPAVTITAPTESQVVIGARTFTVTGTITAGSAIDAVSVTVDGGSPIAATTFDDTSFSVDVSLPDGDAAIAVTVTDEHARTGTDTVTARYPFVTVTTFMPGTIEVGQPALDTCVITPTVGPTTLYGAYGQAAWIGDTLYAPDSGFNRITAWRGFPSRSGEPADFALGQPDLVTDTVGTGASGMDFPQTIAGAGGGLYVLDWGNHRVMGWTTRPTTSGVAADFAVGQPDLDTTDSGCTATNHGSFDDFTIAGGKLFLADSTNHRVLIWNTVPTASSDAPDVVLGQDGFDTCTANTGGIGLGTMNEPIGIWSDGTRLFVVDSANHRVLVWNTIPTVSGTDADWVLGSPDAMTTTGATAADRLDNPKGVAGNGNQLAVADTGNDRVLVWSPIPTANTAAQVVIGQQDFDLAAPNDVDGDGDSDTCSAATLSYPTGVQFVRDTLMVTDGDNHRLVFYGPLPCPTGEHEPPGMAGTCADDPCDPDPCADGQICRNDTGAAVCE